MAGRADLARQLSSHALRSGSGMGRGMSVRRRLRGCRCAACETDMSYTCATLLISASYPGPAVLCMPGTMAMHASEHAQIAEDAMPCPALQEVAQARVATCAS